MNREVLSRYLQGKFYSEEIVQAISHRSISIPFHATVLYYQTAQMLAGEPTHATA